MNYIDSSFKKIEILSCRAPQHDAPSVTQGIISSLNAGGLSIPLGGMGVIIMTIRITHHNGRKCTAMAEIHHRLPLSCFNMLSCDNAFLAKDNICSPSFFVLSWRA